MLAKSRINNGLLLQVIIQIIILIIGATFTYSQHIQYQRERNAVISTALNNRLSSLSTGIINRVNLYQYGLFGLKGFIHGIGIDNLNYQAMQNYSNSRNYALEFPGADGIGFIKRVSPAHLA
ncbi:MAG: CHASE domain-containing protein, partial [Pseudoalteromonas sp.]